MTSKQQAVATATAELADLIKRRTEVMKSLAKLENQIYIYEGSYLEDSQQRGNIMQGWDRRLTTNMSKLKMDKGGPKFMEVDRIFSNSSVTSRAAVSGFVDPGEANNNHNNEVAQSNKNSVNMKSNESIGSMESSASKLPKKESVKKMSSGRSSTKGRQKGLHHDSLDSELPSAASGSRSAILTDDVSHKKSNIKKTHKNPRSK